MSELYMDRGLTFRRRVLAWYRASGRDLPWRRSTDPYALLVSEVMLQQTQVVRVVPAYGAFIRRFPSLGALARAPLGDVLRAWSGLGYNRRARDLHRIARAHPAALPVGVAALDALPGVGSYTAAAVVCFSTGARVPFADTNIRRVLGRVFLGRVATGREAIDIDRRAMPRDAAAWHHALMDLGATVCRARPACEACPAASVCRGRGRASAAPRRRQTAFATSTRRLRGLALRQLVVSPRDGVTRRALIRTLEDDRVDEVLDALVAEGLVTERRGRLGLPDR